MRLVYLFLLLSSLYIGNSFIKSETLTTKGQSNHWMTMNNKLMETMFHHSSQKMLTVNSKKNQLTKTNLL